jgi:hypothetical protein
MPKKKQAGKNFEILKRELGQALGSKDLAEFLGLDEATVRKYYLLLGGIRIGTKYLFFEKEVQRAIQKRTDLDWSDTEGRQKEGEAVQDEAGGFDLGSRGKKKAQRTLEDPYGIFHGRMGQ